MGLVVCLGSFAAALALVLGSAAWLIPVPGPMDPDFAAVGTLGALRFFLPLITAVLTLAAFFGARRHLEWLGAHMSHAVGLGLLGGALTAVGMIGVGVLVAIGPRVIPPGPLAALFAVARLLLLFLPAVVIHLLIRGVRKRGRQRR